MLHNNDYSKGGLFSHLLGWRKVTRVIDSKKKVKKEIFDDPLEKIVNFLSQHWEIPLSLIEVCNIKL